MTEIARDVDLAVGTLYLYFPNKDVLLVECVNDCKDVHDEFVDKILSGSGPFKGRIKKYILHRFHQDQDNRQNDSISATLQNHILDLFPEKRNQEKDLMIHVITTLLKEAERKGEIVFLDNLKTDVYIFMQAIRGFFPLARYVKSSPGPQEKDLLTILNWFLILWNKE